MNNIKSFESFSMSRENCDRCNEKTNGVTTMSWFNTDVICMECSELEKEDPDYDAAKEYESEEVRRGNTNFKGVIPNYKKIR